MVQIDCIGLCIVCEHWSADFLMRRFPHLTALHHSALHNSVQYCTLLLSSSLKCRQQTTALCSPFYCSALRLLTLVSSQCIQSCFSQQAFHSCLSLAVSTLFTFQHFHLAKNHMICASRGFRPPIGLSSRIYHTPYHKHPLFPEQITFWQIMFHTGAWPDYPIGWLYDLMDPVITNLAWLCFRITFWSN